MIAHYTNKLVDVVDSYDLKFTSDDGEIFPISLASVIFENPYSVEDLENRASQIALVLYPDEILNQVIIE
jgi:hypothetical protein